MRAGVREFKNNLSRYLERVRQGDEVIVTDRGRPVARVVPIDAARRASGLDELEAQGLAALAQTSDRSLPGKLIAATAPVSPLVAEQRR
jgi:prevent-host-death family protein